MGRDEVLRVLRDHLPEIDAFGVHSMSVFGSVARDEARLDSDVDILVEFDGPLTYRRYCELRFYIEDLLGRRVDLVTTDGLRPRVRPFVERDAIRVA
jgi:hypothetical protein